MSTMQVAVILPAAGASQRFADSGGIGSKLDGLVDGQPVLARTLGLFLGRPDVCQVIVVAAADQVDDIRARHGAQFGFHDVSVVAGGPTRWASVKNAMDAVSPLASHIAVHDAARPMASAALLDRVFTAAESLSAVAPGCFVRDSLKRVGQPVAVEQEADTADLILGGGPAEAIDAWPIEQAVSRDQLVAIQTPQVFAAELLQGAYAAIDGGQIDTKSITDDAGLLEQLGHAVHIVQGEWTNLKITDAQDLAICQALAQTGKASATKDAIKDLFGDDDE